MPIYEYLCRHCNRIYSFLFATMSDAGHPTCPVCGSHAIRDGEDVVRRCTGGLHPRQEKLRPYTPQPFSLRSRDWDGEKGNSEMGNVTRRVVA